MDPLALFAIGTFLLRVYSRKSRTEAAEGYQFAVAQYKEAKRAEAFEQQKCLALLSVLAECRQAVMGARWNPLHKLLIACGVNGGIFAPPRQVFGERTEQDIRRILADTRMMLVSKRVPLVDLLQKAYRPILLIRGIDFIEARGWIHIPFLHAHVHDFLPVLDLDAASAMADGLGSIGDLEIGDVLSGGLSMVSLLISWSNFSKAEQLANETSKLSDAALRLGERERELRGAGERILILCDELKADSYDLFKWTVLGEEWARFLRHSNESSVPRLSRWILRGLLHRASQLWKTFDQSPFPGKNSSVEDSTVEPGV